MPTDEELLAMSAKEHKEFVTEKVRQRKEKAKEIRSQIRERKKSRKVRLKGFKKSYKALEKAIQKKKIEKLNNIKVKIRERKRVNILARVEDRIPRVFGQRKEPLKRQTFLGKI